MDMHEIEYAALAAQTGEAAGDSLLDVVDARTRLAGSNRMEILLFSLGTGESFGINVFKVKEVCNAPVLTRMPNMPRGVQGIVSLRGHIITVIDPGEFIALGGSRQQAGENLIVTEYSRHTVGFLAHGVDRIIRVDWERVKAPEAMLTGGGSLITAITEMPDGRLVSILDVEQILADAFGETVVADLGRIEGAAGTCVFFADDSVVARRKIVEVLDQLGLQHQHATNGREAWERLLALADQAGQEGVRDRIGLILVDAEMPEMDGYVLTRNIKADSRFDGIPVVMHSSLSSSANRAMGQSVGVDAYVAKFDPAALAAALRPLLRG